MAGKKLQGQVAIITGGGRGIGAATVGVLARAGASVVAVARTEAEIEAVAAALRGEGLKATALPGDVSDVDQVQAVVNSVYETHGRVDILVNNAGVIWPLESVADVDPEEWAYSVHVNLAGPFYFANAVVPLMLEQGYGRIVNVTSAAAALPLAGGSAYNVSKAGLDMLTRVLALELRDTRVTVNSLDPGEVDTEMQADIRSIDAVEAGFDTSYFHDLHARGLLLAPASAARAIYWLVGPWSARETGQFFSLRDDPWRARVEKDLG